jgi:hypothetical protein
MKYSQFGFAQLRVAIALSLCAGLACSLPAQAQPLAAKPAQQATLSEQQLDQLIAARIYRTVVLDLRAATSPGSTDYAIAQAALQHARVFAPQNAELVRALISAAYAASDDASVQEYTKDLVRLDTSDTVAQLRLISSRIRSLQTVDQRIAAYDRLLGSDGDKLDASVRSRLALDAALLAREMGNDESFVNRLKLAVQLDASNKDAALLAMSFASQQADPRARFELLSNLLLSDPLDPAVHLQVRDELAQGGAFVQAERFHNIALRSNPAGPGPAEQLEGLCLAWRTTGASTALAELNKLLAIAKDQQRRALEASGDASTSDLRSPEEVRLPIELDELRVAAAANANDQEALIAAMTDLAASHAEQSQLMRDPVRRGPMDEAEALDLALQHDIEAAAWRMLTGVEGKPTAEALNTLIDSLPEKADDARVPTLRALAAYALGDDVGTVTLTQGVTIDEPYKMLARGLALTRIKGKSKEGAQLLREIDRAMPLTALGAWAGSRATAADITSSHAEAATLGSLARGIPLWVDAMAQKPGVFQMLTVDHDRMRASATDVVSLNARIKNVTNVPLALGEEKTLGSRVALTPRLEVTPPELALLIQGEVIELDRRLRLMPGEELSISVMRPEAGLLSWIIGTGSASPSRLRYRALQGFGFDLNGILTPGPGGVDTTTGMLERDALPMSRLSMPELTQKVSTAYASELPELFIACRAVLVSDEIRRRTANAGLLTEPASTPASAEAEALVAALAGAYATWNPQHRALALTELPLKGDVASMEAFDAAASQEAEPSVLPLVVLTRVSDAANPALATAEASPSAAARTLAALQRKRLEAGSQTLASRGILVTAAPAGATRLPPSSVSPPRPPSVQDAAPADGGATEPVPADAASTDADPIDADGAKPAPTEPTPAPTEPAPSEQPKAP